MEPLPDVTESLLGFLMGHHLCVCVCVCVCACACVCTFVHVCTCNVHTYLLLISNGTLNFCTVKTVQCSHPNACLRTTPSSSLEQSGSPPRPPIITVLMFHTPVSKRLLALYRCLRRVSLALCECVCVCLFAV